MSDRHGEGIVRLVAAGGPQQAQLWRQALEGQGVRCRVVSESLGGSGVAYPGHPVPELGVHKEGAERAQAIREGLKTRPPGYVPPTCGGPTWRGPS
jgi:hypothetical protein